MGGGEGRASRGADSVIGKLLGGASDCKRSCGKYFARVGHFMVHTRIILINESRSCGAYYKRGA